MGHFSLTAKRIRHPFVESKKDKTKKRAKLSNVLLAEGKEKVAPNEKKRTADLGFEGGGEESTNYSVWGREKWEG